MSEKEYDSWVSFEFYTDLVGEEYKQFIYDMMEKFLCLVDLITSKSWLKHISVNEHRWNEEGYINSFYIGDVYFTGCKFYRFDEMEECWTRQLIFRDHYSKLDVKNIFFISDAFEKFLIDNNISFVRRNRLKI